MSWINHSSLDPVLAAFGGQLEHFSVQGSEGLTLSPFSAPALRHLTFENGGLPGEIVEALTASTLPALESLDLWLGTVDYGRTTTSAHLSSLFASEAAPGLKHLGLQNSDDPLADLAALDGSAWLARITSLDLSGGVIGDESVETLSGAAFAHLETLRIEEHHYLTSEGVRRLQRAMPATDVRVTGGEEPDDPVHYEGDTGPYVGRWVSVGE